MQDLLRESIADVSEQRLVEQVIDNCIILEVDGDEHPFVYLEKYYSDMRRTLLKYNRYIP